NADQTTEPGIFQQRERLNEVKNKLKSIESEEARNLETVIDCLAKKSVWIFGGDGWAYDIGFSGVDHVIASRHNVNILVLDTEVYSNTGGQMSKATPIGAVAKFATGGKPVAKKDLGIIAMSYGHVYVAQVAFGAKDIHTLKAFFEAESYDGPSLIIAYSPCNAHGIDLSLNLQQQQLAVDSGHWPLFRYDPRLKEEGKNPLRLDSKKPKISIKEFMETETRFNMLSRLDPKKAEKLFEQAQENVDKRFRHYKQLADLPFEGN
ncbi:thiamine pyrophosphate-dependent enzyme, partial [Thiotrichales bacterium HSG1]|nr:thiamine pyrophosphate-dependent enzyme [Thiotrichales bacterium HSG1]